MKKYSKNPGVRCSAARYQGTLKASINKLTTEQAEAVKDTQEWEVAVAECKTVADFNTHVVPLMHERGEAFKKYAAKVAKDRGYVPNKTTGLYDASAKEK